MARDLNATFLEPPRTFPKTAWARRAMRPGELRHLPSGRGKPLLGAPMLAGYRVLAEAAAAPKSPPPPPCRWTPPQPRIPARLHPHPEPPASTVPPPRRRSCGCPCLRLPPAAQPKRRPLPPRQPPKATRPPPPLRTGEGVYKLIPVEIQRLGRSGSHFFDAPAKK